jgi:glycosyltransferase involved in cell wall biosynthesis
MKQDNAMARTLETGDPRPASPPEISVVIPCYNEEENAQAIIAAASIQLEALGIHDFEIVLIDNASSDRTVELIREVCARDRRVKLIVNSRNFGQMRSPAHAIFQTSGKVVIGLAADFQDPPELIPELIAGWREGYDIVLGVRKDERVGLRLRTTRAISYWLAGKFSDYPLIPQATGFGLYTRRVVDYTCQLAEPDPFFRGMLVETGFPVKTIGYTRPSRAAGKSKNNFFGLLSFALSAFSGSSKRLLRVPIYIGLFGMLMSAMMLAGGLVAFLAGRPIAGWLIGAVVQFEFALLFGLLGLLGENLRMVSERTRRTPLVIEKERINFAPEDQ